MSFRVRFIDVGLNLTDPVFRGLHRGKRKHRDDILDVLNRAKAAGVESAVLTGGSLHESSEALELASQFGYYATVGCHPTRSSQFDSFKGGPEAYLERLDQLIASHLTGKGRCVAVGECGLDYDRLHFSPVPTQQKHFRSQLSLAKKYNLPLFLHVRAAHEDFVRILREEGFGEDGGRGVGGRGGLVHSFTGRAGEMKELVAMGFHIGVNGCSMKTDQNLATTKAIPLHRLMVETGRAVKGRNEPCAIGGVAWVVASLKNCELADIQPTHTLLNMLVTHSRTTNPSPDSLEDTPLVTPKSPNFPSLGSAVELTTNPEPTKSYAGLFAPVPKPLPLWPSFGVDLTSPTRGRESGGRLREPSAGGSERAQALGTVRKMLEELRVSPDCGPVPLAPAKNGTWTPMDRYIPPWKLNRLQTLSSNPGDDTSNSFAAKEVPKVNLNDETLDEDKQLAMLKDLDKEEINTSVWDSIHEAVRVVEKLEGPNWPSWSFWIQRKVRAANKAIWGHIDGSRPRESSDEWDTDEAAIYCALLSSLDFSVIHEQVRNCTTAKEVWDLLEMLYKEKPTPESRAVDLIREMTRMSYFEGGDLQQYLRRFEKIVDELGEGPYPISLELAKELKLYAHDVWRVESGAYDVGWRNVSSQRVRFASVQGAI
ncbi:hypothetical protein FRC11_008510 [Ceratobasidium sp. 423]|nr:hypothetical protein FRC11_008510 [Ceratobasidium sp. 423]